MAPWKGEILHPRKNDQFRENRAAKGNQKAKLPRVGIVFKVRDMTGKISTSKATVSFKFLLY